MHARLLVDNAWSIWEFTVNRFCICVVFSDNSGRAHEEVDEKLPLTADLVTDI